MPNQPALEVLRRRFRVELKRKCGLSVTECLVLTNRGRGEEFRSLGKIKSVTMPMEDRHALQALHWALFTSGGKQSPMKCLESVPVLHWHGDTFDLPQGAELLASTSICQNQAFSYGKSALAFQFHPEASAKNFESWLIGHAVEISSLASLSVTKLRSDTARFAPESAPLGQQCLREGLEGLH